MRDRNFQSPVLIPRKAMQIVTLSTLNKAILHPEKWHVRNIQPAMAMIMQR